MKIVRDYLTSQEIDYIVNAMIEKESAIEREVVKVALVAQLVGEDLGEYNDCNDIYDMVVADDKINFSAIVNNYDTIDKIYNEETGINKILKDFVDDINVKIENAIQNLDLNSAIAQLKEITNKENTTVKGGGRNASKGKKDIL